MHGFDGVRRGNYFGGEPIKGTEVEARVEKLKKGKRWWCETGLSCPLGFSMYIWMQ